MKKEDFKKEDFNKGESIKAQAELCKKRDLPHFAPENGICWRCKNNIYEPIEFNTNDWKTGEKVVYITGDTIEKAKTELITGCPHCNKSYCD